jgi:hypothetical protein
LKFRRAEKATETTVAQWLDPQADALNLPPFASLYQYFRQTTSFWTSEFPYFLAHYFKRLGLRAMATLSSAIDNLPDLRVLLRRYRDGPSPWLTPA